MHSPVVSSVAALRGGYAHYGGFDAENYFFIDVILLFASTKATFGV